MEHSNRNPTTREGDGDVRRATTAAALLGMSYDEFERMRNQAREHPELWPTTNTTIGTMVTEHNTGGNSILPDAPEMFLPVPEPQPDGVFEFSGTIPLSPTLAVLDDTDNQNSQGAHDVVMTDPPAISPEFESMQTEKCPEMSLASQEPKDGSQGGEQIEGHEMVPAPLPVARPKALNNATPVVPGALKLVPAAKSATEPPKKAPKKASTTTKMRVGVQLIRPADVSIVTADMLEAGNLVGKLPEHRSTYENWEGVLELDAVWRQYFDVNPGSLEQAAEIDQRMYWERQAKEGVLPPAHIAEAVGLSRDHFMKTIFNEKEVKAQEPDGPWRYGFDSIRECEWHETKQDEVPVGDGGHSGAVDNDIVVTSGYDRDDREWKSSGNQSNAVATTQQEPAIRRSQRTKKQGKTNATSQVKDTAEGEESGDEEPEDDVKPKRHRSAPTKYRASPGHLRMLVEIGKNLSPEEYHRPRHYTRSWCPPRCADIRLLGPVEVTVIELLTFFPEHTVWKDYITRLWASTMTPTKTLAVIMQRRSVQAHKKMYENHISRITKRFPKTIQAEDSDSDEETEAKKKKKRRSMRLDVSEIDRDTSVSRTCTDWTPTTDLTGLHRDLIDYYVVDVAVGIRRALFPQGDDRGPLTQAIEYVLDHPKYSWVKLSDLEWLCELKGFGNHIPHKPGRNADRDAAERHKGVKF